MKLKSHDLVKNSCHSEQNKKGCHWDTFLRYPQNELYPLPREVTAYIKVLKFLVWHVYDIIQDLRLCSGTFNMPPSCYSSQTLPSDELN